MFKHNFLKPYEMATVNVDGSRQYATPIGLLPSVTTVLKSTQDMSYLVQWRKNVGDKKADMIGHQAQVRGNAVHEICENFLMNQDWKSGTMPLNLELFMGIKSSLAKYVTSVLGIELPLWSSTLRTAGRADLVAEWNNDANAVIDFKTSKRFVAKDSEKLKGYKQQATAYAMMLEERYNIEVPYCAIFMMMDDIKPEIYFYRNKTIRPEVTEIFQKYHLTSN